MTARDILYGRRGGGWVDHDPAALAESTPAEDAAKLEARKEEQRAAIAHYEELNDLVPGTAFFTGRGPAGGQSWDGRARMAAARLSAFGPDGLDSFDTEALGRFPVCEECHRPHVVYAGEVR